MDDAVIDAVGGCASGRSVGVFALQHAQRHIMVVVYNFVFACPSQCGHGVLSKCAKGGRIAGYDGKHEGGVKS